MPSTPPTNKERPSCRLANKHAVCLSVYFHQLIHSLMDKQRAGHVTDNITRALGDAVDVTNQGINKVVGATTDLVVNAASIAPGLKRILLPHVHRFLFQFVYLTVICVLMVFNYSPVASGRNTYSSGAFSTPHCEESS